MTENFDGAAPTRDPDTVETDAHAQSSAEELDEDRLRLDPLEAGMDPPERWSEADRYGMTPYEQAHPRDLDERLAEEEPDLQVVAADSVDAVEPRSEQADEVAEQPPTSAPLEDDALFDDEVTRESIDRGQLADEAGGSVAAVTRIPDEPPADDPTDDDPDLAGQ